MNSGIILLEYEMARKRKKRQKKSALGNSIPSKYTTHPVMITRWMTDIDNYARRKKKKKPRALRHPQN